MKTNKKRTEILQDFKEFFKSSGQSEADQLTNYNDIKRLGPARLETMYNAFFKN